MMTDHLIQYARANRERYLAELQEWLRIPSVSTLPEHAQDVRRAAEWAAAKLRQMGFSIVRIDETPRHPLVYAEHSGLDAPTLLIYGHLDVQPVDPLEEWVRPPFEPTVDGDNLYARGASDDKGQAFAILAALESCLRTDKKLPVNVKIILEGEEEISSPNLFPYMRKYAAELAADAILIADSDMLDPQIPVIMYGVRGNLYVEIEVCGPAQDLHSGTFGGAVDNPFNVLVRILASLQDGDTRRVLIPGFYDQVTELDADERALLAEVPITEEIGLHFTGAPALAGEGGYSIIERIGVRPTLEVHGIVGGFTGAGKKTVIPAKATAKVSMRLVPDQTPERIFNLLEDHLRRVSPPTVEVDLRVLGQAAPVKVDYKTPAVQAAARAFELGYQATPVFLRGGGSLPIVNEMIEVLSPAGEPQIPVVMIGFGLPDDRTHSPNEKIHIPNFFRGIETVIYYLDLFQNI